MRGRLVLLHGEVSRASTWWRIGPELAEHGWHVVALDLPGHGTSPRIDRPLHLPTLVQGVTERLPGQLDLLVGHGLGAVVSLALASRYVNLAHAVVLEDPLSSGADERAAIVDAVVAESSMVRSGRERFVERLGADHPRWAPEDIQYAVEGIEAADVPALVAGLRAPRPWDLPAMLGTLRTPALFVVAPDEPDPSGRGRLSTLRGLDRLTFERRVRAERFAVLDGGHHLHRDVPEQWVKTVLEFADVVRPARRT